MLMLQIVDELHIAVELRQYAHKFTWSPI